MCCAGLDGLVFVVSFTGGVPCCDDLFGSENGGGGFIGDLVGSFTGESESSMYTGVFDGLKGDELADIVMG